MTFAKSKQKFDAKYSTSLLLAKSLVPSNGKYINNISLSDSQGKPSEEYYKWQFIYSLLDSGLYSKDYIGVEIHFPKGNKNSAPIKIDGCIFDSKDWREHYDKWRKNKNDNSIEWLRTHLIGIMEFKKDASKDIKKVFTSQIKAYIKESESAFCIGFYYGMERLYIFEKKGGKVLRYDELKNEKKELSKTDDLSLDIPDAYAYIPSFEELKNEVNKPAEIDRSKRTVHDLDLITGIHSTQINIAISNILKKLDKISLVNQRGYQIIIQMLALKIFDEKRSERFSKYLTFYETQEEHEKFNLLFYITPEEKEYTTLSDDSIQSFIKRIRKLYQTASAEYKVLLKSTDTETINWRNETHVKAVNAIVENLQDYSFIKSSKTDLYQLVFYRFASEFSKVEKGQYITPLMLIDFLVQIVNPRKGESVFDPTVGIADFLSMSYVNAKGTLDDKDIYGVDNDDQMIMLAKLNMLLNGDGNAVLKHSPDMGSLLNKFNTEKKLVPLNSKYHSKGNWDSWPDETKLMKFDVLLTNPPFGDNRKFQPKTKQEREIAELYELWGTARTGESIDLGVLFLENAYRVMGGGGRFGIVLSNSIATIDKWEKVREWLLSKMRIVALFDLPGNTFADAIVNTTLIIAYKTKKKTLERLQSDDYDVFVRDIRNIGYEVKSINRVKTYVPLYEIDETNFNIKIDADGKTVLKEDYSKYIVEFKEWAKSQEEKLYELFVSG